MHVKTLVNDKNVGEQFWRLIEVLIEVLLSISKTGLRIIYSSKTWYYYVEENMTPTLGALLYK